MAQIITDLQIHSKYARAVSQEMVVPKISDWAIKKGIGIVATGDWTHPLWLRELKVNLEEDGSGLLHQKLEVRNGKLEKEVRSEKLENSLPRFLLSGEISCIYSQGGKARRIHTLVFAPSFEIVDKINAELTRRGCNLMSDGRPIIGLTSIQLAEVVFNISEECLIIPAHCWTPWFSLFGSMSGFDSIEEAFGQYAHKIYAVETGLSCYDIETEVLTKIGWKKFPDIGFNDEIYTLNPKTSEVELQKPTKIHKYDYRGKMYRLKTKRVDLLVTPNHQLLYSPCDFRKVPKFLFKEAEFLFNKSKRFKKDGKWTGKKPQYFVLPAVEIKHGSRFYSGLRKKPEKNLAIEPWLKFFGFWIAEGWASDGKRGDYNVCLSNRNNTLLLEMKKILESFGYSVYWDKNITNTLRVRDYQLFHYLKQFGKCFDKFVPLEIKLLSKELLEIFLEYYIKGDGHVYGRTKKGLSATTTSIRLRDDLQEIALKVGMSAYYKLHHKKGTPFKSPGYKYQRIYKQRNDSWVIYFIRRNLHTILPSTNKKYHHLESWVDFKGMVYCVTVPNHAIYIRRNGIPVWCGNSDPAMNWRIKELDNRSIVSFSDAHSGPKLGREATVFEVDDMTRLGYYDIKNAIMQKQGKAKIAYTIEFHPEEGKYHYTGHRACNIRQSPEETKKLGTTCPTCGKPLTVGVMHRVEELASRSETDLKLTKKEIPETKIDGIYSDAFSNRPSYVMLVPLQEILAESLECVATSLKVQTEYNKLTQEFGGEFNVLLKVDTKEIAKIAGSRTAEGIDKVRKGEIVIDPGYDGVFGVVKIWGGEKVLEEEKKQLSLF